MDNDAIMTGKYSDEELSRVRECPLYIAFKSIQDKTNHYIIHSIYKYGSVDPGFFKKERMDELVKLSLVKPDEGQYYLTKLGALVFWTVEAPEEVKKKDFPEGFEKAFAK